MERRAGAQRSVARTRSERDVRTSLFGLHRHWSTAMVELPPFLIESLEGKYELEREIGRGGMATVFRARDLRHGRLVAVKIMHPELAIALGRERFLREIRVAAALQHPNIVAVHDSGEANGVLYYVMPLVEGETLRRRLEREKCLGVEDALRIAEEITDPSATRTREELFTATSSPRTFCSPIRRMLW
jgi:serine/threonine protein kinase